MGLFDKMFGRGASEAEQQQGAQQRFNELKQKYQTVLTTADNEHIQFQNLHVQDNKLFIRGIRRRTTQRISSGTRSNWSIRMLTILPLTSASTRVEQLGRLQVAAKAEGKHMK